MLVGGVMMVVVYRLFFIVIGGLDFSISICWFMEYVWVMKGGV